jgi:uncharacterized protein (DUF488 family)
MDVYTIGHSNIALAEFLDLLKIYNIDSVVDVRSVPYSKHAAHYNKGAIEHYLKTAGIGHHFITDEHIGNRLGGKPNDLECYEGDKIDYEAVRTRRWFQEALSELIEYAKDRRVALLCAEENPYDCHRHPLLAHSLISKGVSVYHIRGDGSLEKAVKEVKQTRLTSF